MRLALWQEVSLVGLREELQRRIDKRSQEIRETEERLKLDRSYLQGLIDTLKLIPPSTESPNGNALQVETLISRQPRHGSDVAKARDAILKAGRPLHITELLASLGKPNTTSSRTGLSGSIGSYVRSGRIFTRPSPNTFFLFELQNTVSNAVSADPPIDAEVVEGEVIPGVKPEKDSGEITEEDIPF